MTIGVEYFVLAAKNSTADYEFDFSFEKSSHIVVSVLESENYQQAMYLVEGTDYKVIRSASLKGGIIRIFDQAAIETRYSQLGDLTFNYLHIQRVIDVSQPIALGDGYSKYTVDSAITRVVMVCQQLWSDLQNLINVEGIYDPQGVINEPNERGRGVIIDNDNGKNKFKGANFIQNANSGDIEFRDGTGLLKSLLIKNVNGDTAVLLTIIAQLATITRGDFINIYSDTSTTRIVYFTDGAATTGMTSAGTSLDINFNLQGDSTKQYTLVANVTGNIATITLTEYGIGPVIDPIPNALAVVVDKNNIRSARNTIDSDEEIVFTNNKTLTFRDTNDAALLMNTLNSVPYIFQLLLDPRVNLLPNTEAELYLTIAGGTILGQLRQNTRFNGIVTDTYIPVGINQGKRELGNSYLRQEVDSNTRGSISSTFDAYYTWRNYNNSLVGGIGANSNSAFKVMLFNFPSTIVPGTALCIESESAPFTITAYTGSTQTGNYLNVKPTEYHWDYVNNALILPFNAKIGFQDENGITYFRAGGDVGNVEIEVFAPMTDDQFLGRDNASDIFTNKGLPGGGGTGSGTLNPGTPWQQNYLVLAQSATTVETIGIKHSIVRGPDARGSIDFDFPGAGIFFNSGTAPTPYWNRFGFTVGSTKSAIFESNAWNDGEALYFDLSTGTIKSKPVASAGGGIGNAQPGYYMVAGVDGVARNGSLFDDGYKTLAYKPIQMESGNSLTFAQGEGRLYLKGYVRPEQVELLIDPNIGALLDGGKASLAEFEKLDDNTVILRPSVVREGQIQTEEPYPAASGMAFWRGHTSSYEEIFVYGSQDIYQTGNIKRGAKFDHTVVVSECSGMETIVPTAGEVTLDVQYFSSHLIRVQEDIVSWTNVTIPDGFRTIIFAFDLAANIVYLPNLYTNCPLPSFGVENEKITLELLTINGNTFVNSIKRIASLPNLPIAILQPYPTVTSVAVFASANGKLIRAREGCEQTGDRMKGRKFEHTVVISECASLEYVGVASGNVMINCEKYSSHFIHVGNNITSWTPITYSPGSTHSVRFYFAAQASIVFPNEWAINLPLETTYAEGTMLSMRITHFNSGFVLAEYCGQSFNRPQINLQVVEPYPNGYTAPAVWKSGIGRHIGAVIPASGSTIIQTGNQMTGRKFDHMVINRECMRSQTVTIAGGVLTLNITREVGGSFVFEHTEDVTSLNVVISTELQSQYFTFLLQRKGGTSTVFPRQTTFYCVNDGTIPFGNAYMDRVLFEHWPDGKIFMKYLYHRNV